MASELIARITAEGALSLVKAAKECGLDLHNATLVRWFVHGILIPGGDGARVYLEGFRMGGRIFTSKAAMFRFLERQQEPPTVAVPDIRTPHQRRKASEAAAKALEEAGI